MKSGKNYKYKGLNLFNLSAVPWTVTCQASLSFTISWSLLKFMSSESVMPSNHVILCCSLLLLPSIFPSIRVFSNGLALHIKCKILELPLHISLSNEYSGLISFRFDCSPRGSQESSPAQFERIISPALSSLWSSSHICT